MNEVAETSRERRASAFDNLDLDDSLLDALERLRFDAPTEIQKQMIPAALAGKDCLARASTGDGKTNSFMLPILQRVVPGEGVQAIILEPTRSLALQLEKNMKRFGEERPVRTAVAGGGQRRQHDTDVLGRNPDVLIATPRGARDLLRRDENAWDAVQMLVVDEADAMLDDRQGETLIEIHESLNATHQTILIAATLEGEVRELAQKMLRDPVEFEPPSTPARAACVEQDYFPVDPELKFDVLLSFLKQGSPKLAILFANGDEQAREIADRLSRARVNCRWIEERGRREPRDRRGRDPRRRGSEVIVANDPAPRRLSIIPATHVVHYELPESADTYELRLTQCARLRKRGGAVIALLTPGEEERYAQLAERIGQPARPLELPTIPERAAARARSRARPKTESFDDNTDRSEADQRSDDAPTAPQAAKPSIAAATAENVVPVRLTQVLYRDAELEARGLRPLPRTLGSRFPTARRSRLQARAPQRNEVDND